MYEASTEGWKAVQARIHVNGAEELTGGGWRREKKECGRNFRFQDQSLAEKPPYAVIRMCGGVSGGESLRLFS